MKLRTLLQLITFTALALIACKKEIITEYKYLDPYTWKKASEIDAYSKYITSAHASANKAVFTCPDRVITKSENGVKSSIYTRSSYTVQTAISDDFYLRYYLNGKWENLGVASEENPNPADVSLYLDTLSNFSNIRNGYLSSQWTAIRTDQKQFIFQYFSGQFTQNFALVDFEEKNVGMRINAFKAIEFNKPSTAIYITTKSFFNKYFICYGEGLEIVDGSGNVLQKNGLPNDEYFFDIVLKGDSLIAFGFQSIYFSTDEGANWNLIIENIPNSVFSVYHYEYYIIDNEIIIFRDDQLVHLQINQADITLKPIVSDALKHNEITSLIEYKDTVYVSTLSGTFKKPLAEFFEYEK